MPSLLKDAAVRWVDDGCYRLASSLAYFALFSLFPLILLLLTVVGYVLGTDPGLRERLLNAMASASSREFRTLLGQTLESLQTHQSARGVGAVVGFATLLFGASAVFSELQFALNRIWRVKSVPSVGVGTSLLRALRDKAISFVVVVGAAFAIFASLVLSTALSAAGSAAQGIIGSEDAAQLVAIETAASVAVLTVIFAAMYRMIPQATVRWKDVFGGAFLTAVLFAALKRLLAWYLAHVGSYAAYGAVGAVLGLLTWIYLASMFLFLGAEFARVYAERFGSLAPGRSPPIEP